VESSKDIFPVLRRRPFGCARAGFEVCLAGILPAYRAAETAALLYCGLARQFQCAPNWIDHIGIERHVRMTGTKTIVKNLAYNCGAAEDTAGHGHRYSISVGKQTPEYDSRQVGQVSASLRQNVTRDAIAGISQG
jgi:hypothetical protein